MLQRPLTSSGGMLQQSSRSRSCYRKCSRESWSGMRQSQKTSRRCCWNVSGASITYTSSVSLMSSEIISSSSVEFVLHLFRLHLPRQPSPSWLNCLIFLPHIFSHELLQKQPHPLIHHVTLITIHMHIIFILHIFH